MKLLFDENLSYKLAGLLSEAFPGSIHVRDAGLKGSPDETIWDLARSESFVLVSKDADFHQRALLMGSPPKVVWIRTGNCDTQSIKSLLIKHRLEIEALEKTSDDILTII